MWYNPFKHYISKMPEQSVLRLSDAYESKSEELDLELRIRFININPGYNEEMVEKSPTLYQYVKFVDIVRKYQKEMRGLTREAKAKLLRYPWPGNVRELQHTMERAVILGDGSLLRPDNFLFQASSPRPKKEEEVLNLEQLERQAVEKAMRLSEGNMTRAAEYLGITRFALYRKIEKLGL